MKANGCLGWIAAGLVGLMALGSLPRNTPETQYGTGDPIGWESRQFIACQSNAASPGYHWSAIAAARAAVQRYTTAPPDFEGIWITDRGNVTCGRVARGRGLERFIVSKESRESAELVAFDDGDPQFETAWASECVGRIVTCRRN